MGTQHAQAIRSGLNHIVSPKTVASTGRGRWSSILLLCVTLLGLAAATAGCGTGGYPGGGVGSLSVAAFSLDAGQSYPVSATTSGGLQVTWTLSGPGVISNPTGTMTTYSAPASMTGAAGATLTASIAGTQDKKVVSITANPAPTLSGNPPNGVVGVPYTTTISGAGGTAPLTLAVAGTLPPGLTFNAATGVISGTPTQEGTWTFKAQLTDASIVPDLVTATETIVITSQVNVSLALRGTTPAGTVGVAYSGALTATGGTPGYSFSLTAGTLPAGLTLNAATGGITGTPTTAGVYPFTAQVKDGSGTTVSTAFSITVAAAGVPLVVSSPPPATVGVPYTGVIPVSGGTGPYSCTVTAGTLPAGLSINSCTISGTPTTAGSAVITVKATDSGSPQQSGTAPVTVTVNPAALAITTGGLPNGTVNVPYSSAIGVTGGTSPYSCTITSGTLQAGLTLGANCLVSGTPTVAGTVNLTVKATDAGNPSQTVSGPVSLTVNPAALAITTGTLPTGTVGTPYSSTIGVTGGTSPYSCTITSGTLQAGLTLGANCLISGTPTVAGTVNLTVKATDAGNPSQTVSGPVSLTVNPALTLVIGVIASGTVQVPYSGTIPVSGGTGPYSCSITAGTLPAGLTLGANCLVSGTPTTPGTVNVTVKATDSSSPTATVTAVVVLTINPAPASLTIGALPAGTAQTPYTGTIPVSGGTAPYTCAITGGTLPAGLSINNCTISGTPLAASTTNLTVKATDSANPANTTTAPVTLTINALSALTFTGSLPNGTVGVAYTQTLTASGGLAPYTYAVTAGTLPAGLTLSAAGVVSGTPTTPGASSFTVTATDSQNPTKTASLPLVLLITYAPGPNGNALKGPYAFLFQGYDDVVAGVLAYQTATIGSFTADGVASISAGELDANHQGSTAATSNTVGTVSFLGTYTLGADYRGLLTISRLKTDGTVAGSTTYAIAVKAPVAPSTSTAQGSLIESDGNQAVGTKGSGTLFQQTPAAYTAGLTGSYAFGLSGDTPCLPACTVGIVAGPAAAVGAFSTSAGTISSGTGDAMIATSSVPSSVLGGGYGQADGNGRIQMTLTTSGTPVGVYPTDYAVYMVSANQALVMSTDVHSSYILLAGTMQSQTQATFSSASMNGPFVGYENSFSNPGLLGTTLQNTLNLSTATIFQGTGAATGTCTINAVDTGGTTSLLNNLTGLGGSLTGLTGLLAASSQTGATTCPVNTNGRGTLQYPEPTLLGVPLYAAPAPRVFYLTAPNAGYFLETAYAGLGRFEAQTGQPYTQANTFTGTYVYGSIPASSLASTDTSGVIVSNGAGSATSTQDLNVGVGTINVIQLGVGTTQPYTTPNGTTGRFTLGASGLVVYAITPDRFVLLDTSALTTSPSVSLLY